MKDKGCKGPTGHRGLPPGEFGGQETTEERLRVHHRIPSIITVPTGDLHAGLHRQTILARTLPSESVEIWPSPGSSRRSLCPEFDRGVGLARRDGPLASLFKVRSLSVLEGLEPEGASALLSGLLIGGEIIERMSHCIPGPVLVAGAPHLQKLYLRAAERLGIPIGGIPDALAARASAMGICRPRALRFSGC